MFRIDSAANAARQPVIIEPPQARTPAEQRILREINFWFGDRRDASERTDVQKKWLAIQRAEIAVDGRSGAAVLFALLTRVREAGQVSHQRQETAIRLLEAMEQDVSFRLACYAQAQSGLDDCHDNALAQFDALGLQLAFQGASSVEGFVSAARNHAAVSLLQDYACQHFEDFGEQLEIALFLRVKLQDKLKLPPTEMRYGPFARTQILRKGFDPDGFVEAAREDVKAGLPERMVRSLLALPSWEEHLRERYSGELEACMAPVHEAMENLSESGAMSSQGMVVRANALGNISQDVSRAALELVTDACVKSVQESNQLNAPLAQRIRSRLQQFIQANTSAPSSSMTTVVRRQLDELGNLRAIAAQAAARASRWSENTAALAADHWGRQAGADRNDPRSDPMGNHFRQQQAQVARNAALDRIEGAGGAAQPAAAHIAHTPRRDSAVVAEHPSTAFLREQEDMELQRALIESLQPTPRRDAAPAPPRQALAGSPSSQRSARPDAMIADPGRLGAASGVPRSQESTLAEELQAFATLGFGALILNPGAGTRRAHRALDVMRRISRQVNSIDTDQSIDTHQRVRFNEKTRALLNELASELSRTSEIVDERQRALAMHADAGSLDILEMLVKGGHLTPDDVLVSLAVLEPRTQLTPLTMIAQQIATLPQSRELRYAQCQLATSAANLLFRIDKVLRARAMEPGAAAVVRVSTSLREDPFLDIVSSNSRAGAAAVMHSRLKQFDLAAKAPDETSDRLLAMEIKALQRLRLSMEDAQNLSRAPSTMQDVIRRVSAVIVAEAGRVRAD